MNFWQKSGLQSVYRNNSYKQVFYQYQISFLSGPRPPHCSLVPAALLELPRDEAYSWLPGAALRLALRFLPLIQRCARWLNAAR